MRDPLDERRDGLSLLLIRRGVCVEPLRLTLGRLRLLPALCGPAQSLGLLGRWCNRLQPVPLLLLVLVGWSLLLNLCLFP